MTKILVLCDDIWHPAEVIEKGFALLLDVPWEFEFVHTAKDILTPEMLREYPLVINCKSNNVTGGNPDPWFEEGVTDAGPEDFRKYVEEGGSFLSIHSGNAFNPEFCRYEDEKFRKPCREYVDFVGNRFTGHPPRCTVNVYVTEDNHPVTKGVVDFEIRDEHYQVDCLADDALVLLETASESGRVMPGGYVREMGKGRLCVLMPGHTLSVWAHPEFQKLVKNAISWCLHEEEGEQK